MLNRAEIGRSPPQGITGLFRQLTDSSPFHVRIVRRNGDFCLERSVSAEDYRASGYTPPLEELPWLEAAAFVGLDC